MGGTGIGAVVEATIAWKEANDARERDWERIVTEEAYTEWSESRAGRHAKALAAAEKALAAAVAALGKGEDS